jgi:hypothetical protein
MTRILKVQNRSGHVNNDRNQLSVTLGRSLNIADDRNIQY